MTSAEHHPPAATRLAWWGTSWLRGHVVADHLIDAVVGADATHLIGSGDSAEGLMTGLGRLRAEGADALGAAYPVDGDPVGLGGPGVFNVAALEAGEAVLVLDATSVVRRGLVPERVGAAVTWRLFPAQRRPLLDVGEADRGLRDALLEAAGALARLHVARWRPVVADQLADLRQWTPVAAPDGVPLRCIDLASRALQARAIADLALADDGGAATAREAEDRRRALRPLARAARHALVAASSPEVWPPDAELVRR